jgi:hypothetical protein
LSSLKTTERGGATWWRLALPGLDGVVDGVGIAGEILADVLRERISSEERMEGGRGGRGGADRVSLDGIGGATQIDHKVKFSPQRDTKFKSCGE